MRIIFLLILTTAMLLSQELDSDKTVKNNVWNDENIWIKTYVDNKNYFTIINNIVRIEQKIKNNRNGSELEKLNRRLESQKSKLKLYEQNKSFDRLLSEYTFVIPQIRAYDYFYKDSRKKLVKKIDKLVYLKNEFNKAYSLLNTNFKKDKTQSISIDDLKYFEEFQENIDKTYKNLIEQKDELEKKYAEYYAESLEKHIFTLFILITIYLIYRVFLFFYSILDKRINRDIKYIYKKIISIMLYTVLFMFLIMRYMEDFMYVITFLSVVAAALTIALREVILNIVGAVYIFFSNILRVGDRVMVQFETKHTIGDILDISLMKIKLSEIEDYSNLKEVKNVGRTIYIPNSYIFTKVFYNYSRKENGLINDLIEFEFAIDNDFENIGKVTNEVFASLKLEYNMSFSLNNLKTGIIGLISYQTHYKEASKNRSDVAINLLQAYVRHKEIKIKNSKASTKSTSDDE